MRILNGYEKESGLSICFCILHNSDEEESLLYQVQKEMSESVLNIRQSYIYGDQTVNALEFAPFRSGYYTKMEKNRCAYPAHEALALAAGMMQKEIEQIKEKGLPGTQKYLLLIFGEKSVAQQSPENRISYHTVKTWVMEQKDQFETKVII